jgi:hypothetical protein
MSDQGDLKDTVPSLSECQAGVRAFCVKMEQPRDGWLTRLGADPDVSAYMKAFAGRLKAMSETALDLAKKQDAAADVLVVDARPLRMHLLLEELSELASALEQHDEVGAFDALVDLLYVTLGAGVTWSLPLGPGFVEVQRSNMSKERQAADPDGVRVRSKGPNYSPPDLAGVLKRARLTPLPKLDDGVARCQLCGGPMPEGEEMFKLHGYSGPCPTKEDAGHA